MAMATPAATTVAPTRGTIDSSTTTRVRVLSGVPESRSRVKGRLRSSRLPATLTARLQPATMRVSDTMASTTLSTFLSSLLRI
jgi:hypothetical protein